ncbi:hypothetical protein H0H92_009333 [Tricholoma furcatifolium]|nr:hypothetical protein H0H92_009333 [Tricholoma furcatifolium]
MKKNGNTSGPIRSTTGGKRMARTFKTDTPKFHSIVHYPEAIARYGTTDSYSTQMGEQEHRRVKRFYIRTNKHRFEKQIGKHERRQARLQAINRLQSSIEPLDSVPEDLLNIDDLPFTDPERHHHMSRAKSVPLNIFKWIKAYEEDEAIEGFYPALVDHLLQRLLAPGFFITPEDRAKLLLLGGIMYYHKALRINYTTYDNRRDQDTINPRTHSDIMVISNDPHHPYSYARVLGVYHSNVRFDSPRSTCRDMQPMEFLWVRWYELDGKAKAGFEAKRQFQVKFRRGRGAFGFIDPANILRAVHLIPNFSRGRTTEFLGHSMARRSDEKDQDYERYYVNMFVDRDMYMRYTGGGIGHRNTREATSHFEVEMKRLWGSPLQSDSSSESESSDSSDDSDSVEDDEAEDPFDSVADGMEDPESEDEAESDGGLQSDEDNPQMDDGEYEQETESALGYEI